MTIGKRKGATAKGAGDSSGNSERFGGSLSKADHFYLQQAYGLGVDPGMPAVGPATDDPLGHTATGGVISDWLDPGPGNVYRTHVYTSSGTLVISGLSPTYAATVDYLVVGGGGGGGAGSRGGGGGAGGLRTNLSSYARATPSLPVSAQTYPVTVGGGGQGGQQPTDGGSAWNGADSSINSPTAALVVGSGGGGGSNRGGTAQPGGSGGGGGDPSADFVAGTNIASPDSLSPTGQGYDGAALDTSGPGYGASGGGGAGAAGNQGTSTTGGPGGAGVQVLIAGAPTATGVGQTSQWFAGGGGGGVYYPQPVSNVGQGAVGGGGSGSNGPNPAPVGGGNAIFATGGGGGGDEGANPNSRGGTGGPGIVAIRYQIGAVAPEAKASGGSISKYNDKWIHVFTTSGTFIAPGDFSETCEVVVVGGGGGGAGGHSPSRYAGAGGGAGGVQIHPGTPVTGPVTQTVTIGGGGAQGPGSTPSTDNHAQAGGDSYWGPGPAPLGMTGVGGGFGAGDKGPSGIEGGAGGSGGGGGDYIANGGPATQPTQAAIPGVSNYGNDGGDGAGPPGSPANTRRGGGGGGAGGAGATASAGDDTTQAHGGIGIQLPTTFRNPVSTVGAPGPSGIYWVAGGGGGGASIPTISVGQGGGVGGPYAGAGPGHMAPPQAGPTACQGLAATGSGGGGGGAEGPTSPVGNGAHGGSGIVLIAYPA